MKKINYSKIISTILFLALLGWMGFYIKSHWQDFLAIQTMSWRYVPLLTVLGLLYILIQGLILKFMLQPFKINLKFPEWFGITIITLLGNYIFPFSGLGFRAAYLKKKHQFQYTHFLSTLAAIYMIEFLIFTLGGLVGLFSWYLTTKFIDFKLLSFFGFILVFCLTFMIFSPKLPVLKNKIYMKFVGLMESFSQLKNNRSLLEKLFVSVVVEFFISVAIFYFVYRALNLPITYLNAMVVAALSLYALLFRITPASFGFYEASIVYTTKLLNLTVANGLLVAMVTRLTNMVWVFVLGPIFSYFILSRKKPKVLH